MTGPLKRLGQTEEFAQWPLCRQLKHLSAGWGCRPRKDSMRKKRLIRRKRTASGQTSRLTLAEFGLSSCRVRRLDAYLRFFSLIFTSALLSAERSFFSSSESSASSFDSYSSTAVQPVRLLCAKRTSLLRLAMRFFTLSSSELAAERIPREMMLLTTPSITSNRELLNSY